MANATCLTGVVLSATGLWILHPAIALVFGGVMLIAAGVVIHKRTDNK